MYKLTFLFVLLFSFASSAKPIKETKQDYVDIQIYFGNITDFKCCHLLKTGEEASFDGFLLQPYQLVFLKDTIDSWQEDLVYQLRQSELLCQEKTSLCQENRNLVLDQYKQETDYYLQINQELNTKLVELKSEYRTFKIITYISIPIVISLGVYATYKF
jgi:hypothetical protein